MSTLVRTSRPTRSHALWALAIGVALIALVGVSGCTSDPGQDQGMMAPPSSSPGSSSHAVSHADLRFMRAMVPLQRQAVRMSRMAMTAGASYRTEALARRIKASQLSQIRSIETCIDGWPGMPMSGMTMMHGTTRSTTGPGMMSGTRMGSLARMHGARFDARFLSMMAAHHHAALAAAHREALHGSDPTARHLATMMAGQQRTELDVMDRMSRH